MSNVFYEKFERHSHGEGMKGQSTPYCPGCGLGLIEIYLAEGSAVLDIPARTSAGSRVGGRVLRW